MRLIHLTTFVAAPVERVFDLSRSIDLHKTSMKQFIEEPIDGITSGLIGLNETVTWKARHLMKWRTHKSKITVFEPPHLFTDEMVEGDFKSLKHEHHFKPCDNGTILIDMFYYEVPYGIIGSWGDAIFLHRYMRKLLTARNNIIKSVAEGEEWKNFLTPKKV